MDRLPDPRAWIRQVARRIAADMRPKKIILFGSHAHGRPRKDSDLDLLVILKRRPRDRFSAYQRVNRAVGEHLWPLDLLVRGREDVQSRLEMGDSFLAEILRRGKVLYSA